MYNYYGVYSQCRVLSTGVGGVEASRPNSLASTPATKQFCFNILPEQLYNLFTPLGTLQAKREGPARNSKNSGNSRNGEWALMETIIFWARERNRTISTSDVRVD